MACQARESRQWSFHFTDAVIEIVLLGYFLFISFGVVDPNKLLCLQVEFLLQHIIIEELVEANEALVGLLIVYFELNAIVLHLTGNVSQVLVGPDVQPDSVVFLAHISLFAKYLLKLLLKPCKLHHKRQV